MNALRRHHRDRVIKKRVKARTATWKRKLSVKECSALAKTATPCSCAMCCNQRRHGFLTMQEIKANLED